MFTSTCFSEHLKLDFTRAKYVLPICMHFLWPKPQKRNLIEKLFFFVEKKYWMWNGKSQKNTRQCLFYFRVKKWTKYLKQWQELCKIFVTVSENVSTLIFSLRGSLGRRAKTTEVEHGIIKTLWALTRQKKIMATHVRNFLVASERGNRIIIFFGLSSQA